ncbi:MAG: T9SS type B sorting domain-containing protein, partial [Saprospiraceae bacterium]|nr:T9SS type B sorting domain-containing protein [Saprospiraceae bacterium]
SGDLSGTHISGDKNFAVFGGNSWTEVPTGCAFRDNLLEQMFPISTWGKQFVTVPSDKVLFDVFRIMASEDNTSVEVQSSSNIQSFNLNAGEYVEYQNSQPSYIIGNKPVQVAQFNIGETCGGYSLGDPSMLLLNSIEQRRDTVTLFNSRFQDISENYINVVISTEDFPFVTLDGAPIPASARTGTVGANGEFTYIQLQVNEGAHTIISQACGVIASAYGYGSVESYSYGGGANFNSINVNPIPDGGCLNDTVFFDANLPDSRYRFFWDLGDGNTSTASRFNHFYPSLGTYPVELIIEDQCQGTVDTLNKDLLISLREAVSVSGPGLVCVGEGFSLEATDLANASYEWQGPGQYYSESQFPEIRSATLTDGGTYSAIGIISGCATYPAEVEVEVAPLPKPNLGSDTIFCNLDSATVITPGDFPNYHWNDNSDGSELNVIDEGTYWVEVSDENGCAASDTIILRQQCPTEVFIPNAFSPNMDGFNDFFEVFGHDIIRMKIQVFDRWGNHVFTGNSQQESWDGTHNGKIVPAGVYVWVLEIEGYYENGEIYTDHQSGTLTVIK